jgi:hypothetical protein
MKPDHDIMKPVAFRDIHAPSMTGKLDGCDHDFMQ